MRSDTIDWNVAGMHPQLSPCKCTCRSVSSLGSEFNSHSALHSFILSWTIWYMVTHMILIPTIIRKLILAVKKVDFSITIIYHRFLIRSLPRLGILNQIKLKSERRWHKRKMLWKFYDICFVSLWKDFVQKTMGQLMEWRVRSPRAHPQTWLDITHGVTRHYTRND